MANHIGRVIGGYSCFTKSEHYIIEMTSQISGEKYRHQVFIDNTANKAYHMIDGVEQVQEGTVLSARFDVLRFALYVNDAKPDVFEDLFFAHRLQSANEFWNTDFSPLFR